MYYEKSEYERLIAESPVFILDKDRERSRYRREALKLVEYLYCYLMLISKTKYEPYGVEIVEVAKRCISNFNPDTGVFLHYFNSTWKAVYGHLVGKELIRENFQGIHFTEEQSRNYKKYMKLVQSMGMETNAQEFEQKVAEAMGLTMSELKSLKQMVECKPISGIVLNDEGEEYSFIDQIDSGVYVDTGVLEAEKVKECLEVIQIVFDGLQDRQKPMMTKLITAKLSLLARDDTSLLKVFQKMSYFDEEIFNECVSRGMAVEAREISKLLGVAEASTSRSWKIFKQKLRLADLQRR